MLFLSKVFATLKFLISNSFTICYNKVVANTHLSLIHISADAAAAIGEGLQAFCIPGSVADHRKVGLGHGNLGKMLLEEETRCV